MKKLPLILAFICLFLIEGHARNSRLYGSGEMSSNLISNISLDGQGFVWVASEYGLNRFDGFSFKQYLHNPTDSTSLIGNNVRTLYLDSDETLWIGCSNGLQYYSPQQDAFVNIVIPSTYKPHITGIVEVAKGELWITTSGMGMYRVDKATRESFGLESITSSIGSRFLSCIYITAGGMVWIGSDSKGAVMVDPATKSIITLFKPDSPNIRINDIIEDNEGNIFLSASTRIIHYDPTAQTFSDVPYLGNGYLAVRAMTKSRNGGIFVGTDGQGLKFLDCKNLYLTSVYDAHEAFGLDYARIYALIEDAEQNLWIGCAQKGILMKPNVPTQFDYWSLPLKQGELGGTVNSIYKDRDGSVWCAADNDGLLVFNYKGDITNHYPSLRAASFVFEDSDNKIWVRSRDLGTMIVDKKTARIQSADIPSNGFVKAMDEDSQKNLYISTFGAGFMQYNLITNKWRQFGMRQTDPIKGNLANDWINVILCDSRGLVWLGHYKGISCYDPFKDIFIRHRFDDILSDQICISIEEDSKGNIWAGTYNGLYKIDLLNDTVQSYTTADGLSNNMICGLAVDRNDDVWCSTFNGINHLDVKNNRFVNYYSGNGLVDKTYNSGVYFTDNDGVIYFGGNNGITAFSPEDIKISDYTHKVSVVNMYIHSNPISINTLSGGRKVMRNKMLNDGDYHLSYDDNTFTLELTTMDFLDPENIHFEYRLKDLSEEWSATMPGMNRITYNLLTPGRYILEVRASKYGSFSSTRQFSIRISPPWYKSITAYVIYSICLLSLAALVVNIIGRKRREVVNEAKLQFFINISHEIRSPLTLIISPLEKLLKVDHDPTTNAALHNMHRNTKRILGLVNQLLDIRKIDKGQMKLKYNETDLVGFIGELFEIFEFHAQRRNIVFTFEHLMEQLPVWIDRNNFDKILMNVLSNAFKYTPDAGEVTIVLTSGIDNDRWGALRHYAEIRVTDSGPGIDEDKMEKIFTRFYQAHNEYSFGTIGSGIGLSLSRTLVEMHQGIITATNRNEVKGACFTIRIPLGNEHLKREEINTTGALVVRNVQQLAVEYSTPHKKRYVRSKTNYKILVVDDEPEIRDYIKQELEQTYRVITSANGEQALKIALSEHPDLIISDVMMPVMDGFRLLQSLKNNSNVSHIPVILLTSKIEHEDRMEGLDKGAEAYLTKPFNTDELLVTIDNLIKNRRMLRGKFSGAQDQKQRIKPMEFKSSDEKLMERIMTILNENIDNPELNVEMLAKEVGISRVQLHRKLKELTGLTSSEFIRELRLKQAAGLLGEKRMNISQIAYAVGFSNQTHFSTAFKKFYGISPSEYIIKASDTESRKETTSALE